MSCACSQTRLYVSQPKPTEHLREKQTLARAKKTWTLDSHSARPAARAATRDQALHFYTREQAPPIRSPPPHIDEETSTVTSAYLGRSENNSSSREIHSHGKRRGGAENPKNALVVCLLDGCSSRTRQAFAKGEQTSGDDQQPPFHLSCGELLKEQHHQQGRPPPHQ